MTYKGTPIRLSKDFTEETLRPEERDTFKTMKGNNNNNKKYIYIQPRTLYTARLFFRFYGEIKALQTSKRLKNLPTPNQL